MLGGLPYGHGPARGRECHNKQPDSGAAPWVVVSGGFHWRGGTDRANAELARFLADCRRPVHIVGYDVDPFFDRCAGIHVHRIAKVAGSHLLSEFVLAQAGCDIAARVKAMDPRCRVVVNGSNCMWPDMNWVHCVQAAWPCFDPHAPAWFRIKNRITKQIARMREAKALKLSSCVFANSERTKRDLLAKCGLTPDVVHVVYLGSDDGAQPATAEQRAASRSWLGVHDDCSVVAFVGAAGHDDNKGLGTLLGAWAKLARDPSWRATLIVAGDGSGLVRWREWCRSNNLDASVRMLGFTTRVTDVLAAADLLVSPVRYEAFGLNVQEALCREIPCIVSRQAGVTERITPECERFLLNDPSSITELADCLSVWRRDREQWQGLCRPLAAALRAYTWRDMARRMVAIAEGGVAGSGAGA